MVQKIILGENFGTSVQLTSGVNQYIIQGNGQTVTLSIVADETSFTLLRVSRTVPQAEVRRDCIRLQSDRMSWYGGPQQKHQYWPVDKLTFNDYSYVTKELDNCGITERYWLNSRGSFIYVEPEVPLFLQQNVGGNDLCLIAKKTLPYDTHTTGVFSFSYYIGVGVNARDAHLQAIDRFLKKPTGYPDELMTKYPIWSTWAKYKRDITPAILLELADAINTNGFTNSQFEIDDDWEQCYGALTFSSTKFPDPKATTDAIKAKNFRVTLWIHPFINKVCEPWYTEAKTNGYVLIIGYQSLVYISI